MPLLNISHCDINFVRAGARARAPLVFLHPVGLDSTWWGDQFSAFGSDHDVVAIDMPGHGLSTPLEAAPTFELLSDVVEAVLVHLEGGPLHVVGISVGGMIAQTLALRRPDLVRSLSLVATLCTFTDPVRAALRERVQVARDDGMARIAQLSIERWFPAAFRRARPDMMDRARQSLLRQDPAFHAAMWEMISRLDVEEDIADIACPTLVVVGAEDVNAPLAAGQRIASRIPHAQLTEMPGVGHFPPFEAPARFNAILRAFVDRVDRDMAVSHG